MLKPMIPLTHSWTHWGYRMQVVLDLEYVSLRKWRKFFRAIQRHDYFG